MLGTKKFGHTTFVLGPKRFWVQGSKTIFGPTNFRGEKLWKKKNCVWRFFGPKIFGQNNCGSKETWLLLEALSMLQKANREHWGAKL